jgi:hypothetical protein
VLSLLWGTTKGEKVDSIAVVVSFALVLLAAIGGIYTGQVQGYFQLVGFSVGILFCGAYFHYRYRVGKEKRAHSNTTTLQK